MGDSESFFALEEKPCLSRPDQRSLLAPSSPVWSDSVSGAGEGTQCYPAVPALGRLCRPLWALLGRESREGPIIRS